MTWANVFATLGVLGGFVGAVAVYLGATFTAKRSKEGVNRTAEVNAQDSALKAWIAFVKPIQDQVKSLTEHQQQAEEKSAQVDVELGKLRKQIERLEDDVKMWQRVARAFASWAHLLRTEVELKGGIVPPAPAAEMRLLEAIEEAQRPRGDDPT